MLSFNLSDTNNLAVVNLMGTDLLCDMSSGTD